MNVKLNKVSVEVAQLIKEAEECIFSGRVFSKKCGKNLVVRRNNEIDVFSGDSWIMRGSVYDSGFVAEVAVPNVVAVNRVNAYFDSINSNVVIVWKSGKAYALDENDNHVELKGYMFYSSAELYKLRNGYSNNIKY